jgi:DNA (cytosine-5)-methyltransferase 1
MCIFSSSLDYRWLLSELPSVGLDAPKVFSVFAGGGGSSMGYKLAGFNVVGACEIDSKMSDLYRENLNPK